MTTERCDIPGYTGCPVPSHAGVLAGDKARALDAELGSAALLDALRRYEFNQSGRVSGRSDQRQAEPQS